MADLTWTALSGTDIDSSQQTPVNGTKASIFAYCGLAVQETGSVLWVGASGGHEDSSQNSTHKIVLSADTPAWTREKDQSPSTTYGAAYNPDGQPAARHTFWNIQFIEQIDRLGLFGGSALYGNGGDSTTAVDLFNPTAKTWTAAGTNTPLTGAIQNVDQSIARDSSGNVWVWNGGGAGPLYRWNSSDGSVTLIGDRGALNSGAAMMHDPVRNRLIVFDTTTPGYFDLNAGASWNAISFTGANASAAQSGCYAHYDEIGDRYLLMRQANNTVYQVDPSTFSVTTLSISGSSPPAALGTGIDYLYGRWFRCPELGVSGVVRNSTSNIYVFATGTPA